MSRLIEMQHVQNCLAPLAIRVGDLLLIQASGGRIQSGSSVELWGPYLPAVAAATGEIVTAMGSPNAILVRAREPGSAVMEVFTGDPWRETRTTTLRITAEA
jgi:hypothetical protein